ncbi:MAG: GGDEF domain-containing protein [Thiobacillus sp.]
MTGLPLRYSIESDFTFYQNDARRNRGLLYVVMIDLDNFKLINDRHGHPVGDMVLRHLADTLKSSLRGNEPLYRFGGEEFLWLLPCNAVGEAEQSARRLMEAVNKAPFRLPDGKLLKLTLTLGLAQAGDHEELASAIKRSDRAMYKGKKAGRDRYVLTRI